MYTANTSLIEGKTLVLSLSTEELALVTAAMQLPSFLGFRPPTLPNAAAVAGERSLRLRGFAHVEEDGKYVLQLQLAQLLSVCAVPSHMIVVMPHFATSDGFYEKPYDRTPMRKFHFFCVRDAEMVYHNRTKPGVHIFAAISSPDFLKMTLAATLEVTAPQAVPNAPAENYEVDQASLRLAEGLYAEGGETAVIDRLVNDLNAPESLARALASRKKFLLGVVWRSDWQADYPYTDDTLFDDSGFVVLPAEEGGVWAYHFEGNNPRMAIFEPMSAEVLIEEMVSRLHANMGMA